jgi:hypothetical protein
MYNRFGSVVYCLLLTLLLLSIGSAFAQVTEDVNNPNEPSLICQLEGHADGLCRLWLGIIFGNNTLLTPTPTAVPTAVPTATPVSFQVVDVGDQIVVTGNCYTGPCKKVLFINAGTQNDCQPISYDWRLSTLDGQPLDSFSAARFFTDVEYDSATKWISVKTTTMGNSIEDPTSVVMTFNCN